MTKYKKYCVTVAALLAGLTFCGVFFASTAFSFADETIGSKSKASKTGLLTINSFRLPSDGLLDKERAALKRVQRIVKIFSEASSFDEAREQTAGIPHELWSELDVNAPFDSISFYRHYSFDGRDLFGVTLISSKGAVDISLNYLYQRDLQELINNRKAGDIEPTATYWSVDFIKIFTFGSKETFNVSIQEDYELVDPEKPINFEHPEKSTRSWWHLREVRYEVSKVKQSPLVMERTNVTTQDIKEQIQRGPQEILYVGHRCSWSEREITQEMFLDAPVPPSYFSGKDGNSRDDIPEIKRKNVTVTWED